MMICCGMAIKRLGVNKRKMKALPVTMERVTLTDSYIESDILCALSV
jgi:hypothetical protein